MNNITIKEQKAVIPLGQTDKIIFIRPFLRTESKARWRGYIISSGR